MLLALGITNNTTKILLATNQLRDPAELWWTSVKETQDLTGMRWETFTNLFKDKFYPLMIESRKKFKTDKG